MSHDPDPVLIAAKAEILGRMYLSPAFEELMGIDPREPQTPPAMTPTTSVQDEPITFPFDAPDYDPFHTEEGKALGYDRSLVTAHFDENRVFVYTGGHCIEIQARIRESIGYRKVEVRLLHGPDGCTPIEFEGSVPYHPGWTDVELQLQSDDVGEVLVRTNGWCLQAFVPGSPDAGLMVGVYNEHAYGLIGFDEDGTERPGNKQGWVAMAYDYSVGLPIMNGHYAGGRQAVHVQQAPGLYLRGDETW